MDGCTAEDNETVKQFVENGILAEEAALNATCQPLPLTNLNVAYYYVRYGSVLGLPQHAR